MDRWVGKVCIVTGSSAGIGADIAEKLSNLGLIVAGFQRREPTGKKGNVYNIQCDVTNEESVENSFKWVKDNLGPVHVLVNNAGTVRYDTISDGDPKNFKQVLDTNVFGVVLCCHHAIRQMNENGIDGHIININSLAGHRVLKLEPPKFNVYSPSKFAVTALTDVLANEFLHFKTKIKVTSVSPGLVSDTEIFNVAGYPKEAQDYVPILPHIKPEDVSNAVIYALGTPPHVQVSELTINAVNEVY